MSERFCCVLYLHRYKSVVISVISLEIIFIYNNANSLVHFAYQAVYTSINCSLFSWVSLLLNYQTSFQKVNLLNYLLSFPTAQYGSAANLTLRFRDPLAKLTDIITNITDPVYLRRFRFFGWFVEFTLNLLDTLRQKDSLKCIF